MLGGNHRYKFVGAIDAQKVGADGGDFPEIGAQVLPSEMPDIQPQVGAVWTFDAKTLPDVIHHPTADHVPAGQLFFRRLVVGHETVQVFIQQITTVPPATFGNQNVGGHDAGGMELHCLHISQGHHPGVQGNGHTGAFVNNRIGGSAVDPAIAAGSNNRGLGQIGPETAGAQAADYGAVAFFAVVDKGHGLDAIVDGNTQLDNHGIHGILQHMAGAVRGITGAPLGSAAKGPLGDETFFFR